MHMKAFMMPGSCVVYLVLHQVSDESPYAQFETHPGMQRTLL